MNVTHKHRLNEIICQKERKGKGIVQGFFLVREGQRTMINKDGGSIEAY